MRMWSRRAAWCKKTGLSGFCVGGGAKSGLARDLGGRLQSRNVPFDTSGDSLHEFQSALYFLAILLETVSEMRYDKQ